MIDVLTLGSDWFMGLGREYGVDPMIFGSIYVATIPFFWASVAWLVRSARRGTSIALPVCSTCFFTVAAYAYPFAVGENLPVWMYLVAAGCIVCCGLSTLRTIRSAVRTPSVYAGTTDAEGERSAPGVSNPHLRTSKSQRRTSAPASLASASSSVPSSARA